MISFLNELERICLHNIIVVLSTQLNGFNYNYRSLIIQFKISCFFVDSEVAASTASNTNSIQLAQSAGPVEYTDCISAEG